MRILCVTDQNPESRESLIEGIFRGGLREYCTIFLVLFSREAKLVARNGNEIILPYRYKRGGAAALLAKELDLHQFDLVIVRNFFPVLSSFLKIRGGYRFRLGFWNTFPHTFRRYFEALQERRAVLRKGLEYRLRNYWERKLVARCDFLIVMSEEFKRGFFEGIEIPYHCLPMGFSLAEPARRLTTPSAAPRKLVYIGAIDSLRRVDLIIEAMTELGDDFLLDIYTQSDNATVSWIRGLRDLRVRLCPALPRHELLRRLAEYDAGIGLIPENPLYNVSSPTKTVEYYAVGLPALVNYLPEYRALFDRESAFFCAFTREGIKLGVREILQTGREELAAMGERGRRRIEACRNYQVLSRQLFQFLHSLEPRAGS